MPVIVDPQQWESASRVMGGDVAGGLTAVHRALVGSLQHTRGMGGADSSGQAWAGAYELCATALMGGLAAVQHGALKLASLLQRTGFNHALAEQMSGGGTPPVDTAPYATNTGLLAGCGDIPQPAGGAANYPEGWSLVKDHLHYEWPNADLGDLHAAATAWTAAQTSLTALTSTVDLAVAAVREQSSPEVADATLACGAVSTHLTALAGACGILASGCLTFAQAVASAQSKVKNLLVGLAVQAAAVEAAGAVAAFLTFGAAEVAAQATLAYEITSCVEDIVTLLSLLQSTSAHAIAEMKPVVQTMIEIENDLAPLLGTEVVAAETTQAPSARSAAEREREKQAAAAVAATVVLASAANASADPKSRWNDSTTLADHFKRHGSDFGAKSEADYCRQAADLLRRSKEEGLPTKIDSKGNIRVYDPKSCAFGSYTPDGLIRTFFKPTSPTYWDRQPGVLQ